LERGCGRKETIPIVSVLRKDTESALTGEGWRKFGEDVQKVGGGMLEKRVKAHVLGEKEAKFGRLEHHIPSLEKERGENP